MKNKFFVILISMFFFQPLMAENLNIQSSEISIDKKTRLTIFKGNVVATDHKNNVFKSEYAEYKKNLKFLKSTGETTILTSEGYFLSGENIIFDNKNKSIRSENNATIKDLENNNIYLENFEYSTENNFFKSAGKIKIVDSNENSYNFSQIYIDEKKREIIGTDIKAFLNQENFKVDIDNKPRVFANTVKIDSQNTEFTKSIFTLCNYRKKDKCPPWSLQAGKMTHNKKKKTIYYDNAVIKIYDLPIFYLPKLSHPDPTVDRMS
jgi:LPS-assembly protein